MYVYVCLRMFTYVYVCLRMFTYVYVRLRTFMYVYVCLCMFMYVYVRLRMFTYVYVRLRAFTCVYVRLRTFNLKNCNFHGLIFSKRWRIWLILNSVMQRYWFNINFCVSYIWALSIEICYSSWLSTSIHCLNIISDCLSNINVGVMWWRIFSIVYSILLCMG